MGAYEVFIADLVRGKLPAASPAELNGLLHWLAGRSNEAAVSIDRAFNAQGTPRELARRHTLLYLDYTLFCHRKNHYRLFGLTPECSLSEIRARHKQLLQIFHPDRHADDREWFTERTEQLNRAYAYLQANHGRSRSGNTSSDTSSTVNPRPTAPRKPSTTSVPKKPGLWRSLAANKNRFRRKLKAYIGNPLVFERRLYVVLYSIPILLLVLVYLHHADDTYGEHASSSGEQVNTNETTRFQAGTANDEERIQKLEYVEQ